MAFINQLEPGSLIEAYFAAPPDGFTLERALNATPVFTAAFDLLTTTDDSLRRRLASWPGFRQWSRLLRWPTTFVGTTVSEYALFPTTGDPRALPTEWLRAYAHRQRLLIVKDIPLASPLLDAEANAYADALAAAAIEAGFVLIEGQALAHVPIDFASTNEYLGRLSAARRKDIRRKLRSRSDLDIERMPTGDPRFASKPLRDEFHALFEQVYAQSEIHFDHPSAAFFDHLLTDLGSAGSVFCYRHQGRLIGWNLCFENGGRLIDKYVGFLYPDARMHNLYALSWMHNLDYACVRGLSHYVAGWTDPAVKAQLGAKFTFTRHAVYARNPVLRALLRRIGRFFESDRIWRERSGAAQ